MYVAYVHVAIKTILVHKFENYFKVTLGDVWGYPVVLHLEIVFKSVHEFRYSGNTQVRIQCKDVTLEWKMLTSLSCRFMIVRITN